MTPAPNKPSPFGGLVLSLSLALVLVGAYLLALLDTGTHAPVSPSPSPSNATGAPVVEITVVLTALPPFPTTPPPIASPAISGTPSPTMLPGIATVTPAPPTAVPTLGAIVPTPCVHPAGWSTVIVQPGETLFRLSILTGTTSTALQIANCLPNDIIFVGQVLSVPYSPSGPTPLPTPRPPCNRPPITWIPYVVQIGDTLYRIAVRFGTTYQELHRVNCMWSYNVLIGQTLYVPPYTQASATPLPPDDTDTPEPPPPPDDTDTPEPPPSATLAPATNTLVPPTATFAPPTDTPVPPTNTSVPPTDTPAPPPPTDTPVPPTDTPPPPPPTDTPSPPPTTYP